MVKGYSTEDIRQKLITILDGSLTGMSGVDISRKVGINRITMTKYLKVFEADGLLRHKNIGNVTLWFLEPGQESFDFPDDYFKIGPKYLEYLIKGTEAQVFSLIHNCLRSGATVDQLTIEVILPTIEEIQTLYDDGKIGISELKLLQNIPMITNRLCQISNSKHFANMSARTNHW